MAIILSNLNRFSHFFRVNLQYSGYYISPYLAFVATLPRETMSENKRLI